MCIHFNETCGLSFVFKNLILETSNEVVSEGPFKIYWPTVAVGFKGPLNPQSSGATHKIKIYRLRS